MFTFRLQPAVRALLLVAATSGLIAACTNTQSDSDDQPPTVALILKTRTNPFFVTIERAAQRQARERGLHLSVAAGNQDGDVDTQIAAIDAAIERGDKAILITPNGPGVNDALRQARDAGLFVVALDTKPDDPDAANITYATDNFEAGRLIGEWSARKMNGRPAVIAMLDLFTGRGVESDSGRDQGFLTGMGIPVADPRKNGDEAPTGRYSAGPYRIACHETTLGAHDQGKSAMERCLAITPDINLVYTINEPAASGAAEALRAAGSDATMVSVDGGCEPGMRLVREGVIGATAQQYPERMATEGVDAIADYLESGTRPTPTHGIDLVTTGVALVTDEPQPGVPSIDVAEGLRKCWGKAD